MKVPPVIAVNTRLLISGKTEGIARFAIEILKKWVLLWPSTTFYFLFDRKVDPQFIFAKNVHPVVIHPMARHPFLFYLWFHVRIKSWLKKKGNPPFFSPEGYIPLNYKGLTFNTIHDINFEEQPEHMPLSDRWYYKKYFPKYANQSTHLFTVSHFSKRSICSRYKVNPSKVSVVYNAVSFPEDEPKLLDKTKKYLLYVGSLNPRKNLKRLVEAFKKLQQDEAYGHLELWIVGLNMWGEEPWQKELDKNSYIHLLGRASDAQLVDYYRGAHALIYPSLYEGFGLPVIEAQYFGCPVACSNSSSLPEIAQDSALYFNPEDVGEIHACLKDIVSNQTLRDMLIQKGIENVQRFSWNQSAEQIAHCVAEHYA